MLIKVAQIKAMADLVKDMADNDTVYVNPRVKGGADNGELSFGHGYNHQVNVIGKTGRVHNG